MATPAPANDAATGQRIVNDLNANFIVEAGAGTGKTYALVSRAVALVKAGHPMPGIVAITFTEAAAAELSERIRSRLEQLLDNNHPDNANDLLAANLTPDHRDHIRKAIAELDQASVQTIHSFAAQLLRERPLSPAVGLPPGWIPQDDVDTKERFSEEWDNWLGWALGKDTGVSEDLQTALRYLIGANAGIPTWEKIAQSFSDRYSRISDDVSITATDLLADIGRHISSLKALQSECKDQSDGLYLRVESTIQMFQSLQGMTNTFADASIASPVRRPNIRVGNTGRSANWENGSAAAPRSRFQGVVKDFDNMVLTALASSLRERFAVDYTARRKAEGVATFDDLLVWARDLLRNDADARQHFQNKYSHILIDEFQDTDPLQAEIAFYLAAAPDADIQGQPWYTLPLTPGKLFIVGDAKQSIYRFRNADLAVVQQVKNGGQLAPLTISENRRSQTPVLDWVNAVFGGNDDTPGLMQGDEGIQADYILLQHNAGIQQAGLGAVQVFGGPSDDKAGELRQRQAEHVASLIAAYAGNGAGATRLNVYDKGSKSVRPANLDDVCILIRSRNGLGILTRALDDAGIFYRLEGASLFFDTQEVQDLLNCLRAIDDPADEVSVVAALRSPAFACSDADLLRWRDAFPQTPVWNYQSRRLDADAQKRTLQQAAPSVWDGMRQLRECHQQSRTESVAPLIAEFIRHRRLDELDLAENRPREIWRRRQFLVEQARSQEYAAATSPGAPPLTLRRFLNWTESRQQENARITEVAVPETDDDAVRIMTMHAAKGLEFPIAILLGLDYDPTAKSGSSGYPPVLYGAPDTPIEVLAGPWNDGSGLMTPGYQAAIATEDKHSDAEAIRLAYVGATRARDHLLVSLYHNVNKQGQSKDLIHRIAALPNLPHSKALPDDGAGRPVGSDHNVAANNTPNLGPYEINDWEKQRDAAINLRSRPQAVTATSLAHSNGVPIDDKAASPDQARTTGRGGRGGTAFGSALHSVLQNIVDRMLTAQQPPLSDGASVADLLNQWGGDIEKLAKSAAKTQGLTGRDGEITTLARRALASGPVVKALRAPRLWPEIPVAAPIAPPDAAPESVVVEGIIDLLYEDNDGQLVILDYKSDAVSNDSDVTARMQHYRWQGAAYAAAIERATGKMVKDVQFLFVRLDEKDQPARSVDDLRSLVDQVPERVAGPP